MAERYERVFTLKENLYLQSSPVLIRAGALLKDTQTGNIIAQFKFENIQNKPIKAIKVGILPLDVTGKPLGEEFDYTYLDFVLDRRMQTGDRQPIFVKEPTCRAVSARVKSVAFADNSEWNAPDGAWESLPPLSPMGGDPELVKQYRMEICPTATFQFAEYKDLWFCSCGALNCKGEERCAVCGGDYQTQRNCDFATLKANRDKRVKEEQEIAAQQEEKRRIAAAKIEKRLKKWGIIGGSAAAVIVAGIIVFSTVIFPKMQYNKAMGLLASGDYESGYAILEEIGDHETVIENLYDRATQAYQSGDYQTAKACFYQAGDYKDAIERYQSIEALPQRTMSSAGELQKRQYDNKGNLIKDDDYTYEYDTHGNMIKRIDKYGNEKQYVYNNNRLMKVIYPSGATDEYAYDDNGNLVQVTDSIGRNATLEYNSDNLLIKTVDVNGKTITYEYDANGRITKGPGTYGVDTIFEYDDNGHLVNEICGKNKVSYQYESNGRNIVTEVYQEVNRSDYKTIIYTNEYDEDGNRIKRTGKTDKEVGGKHIQSETSWKYSDFVYFPKKEK